MDTSPSSIWSEPVGGRYKVTRMIGHGGMAQVYAARDIHLHRDVALKLFAPQPADLEELRRRQAEVDLLATLNHSGLVTLFDAGTDTRDPSEPRPFLTMELVEGQDLRVRIRDHAVPLDELAVIGEGLAGALAYIHSRGVIHRDVKPGNILLVQVRPGEPLRPKLTDFGIARTLESTRLTTTGTMIGTAAYLSPEQTRGADLGPSTDIYSLGLVLLECLKGSLEYPGTAVESAVARLHRSPVIPDSVPAEWAHLLRAMTALDPADRPEAAAVEEALRRAVVSPASLPGLLEGHPRESQVTTSPATPERKILAGFPQGRRRTLTALALTSAALVTLVAGIAFTQAATAPMAPAVGPSPVVSGSPSQRPEPLREVAADEPTTAAAEQDDRALVDPVVIAPAPVKNPERPAVAPATPALKAPGAPLPVTADVPPPAAVAPAPQPPAAVVNPAPGPAGNGKSNGNGNGRGNGKALGKDKDKGNGKG